METVQSLYDKYSTCILYPNSVIHCLNKADNFMYPKW